MNKLYTRGFIKFIGVYKYIAISSIIFLIGYAYSGKSSQLCDDRGKQHFFATGPL